MANIVRDRIVYDERLTEQEVEVLESRSGVFLAAVLSMDQMYWTFVEDARRRRYYQFKKNADRSQCFVELTLDEIGSLDDEDIKRIIIFHERPCIDVERRVEKWIQRLNSLYTDIHEWIQERPDWEATVSAIRQQDEQLMRQRGVAPRDVPSLTLECGERSILFRPSALFVVGANGRVDVIGANWQRILIDLSSDDSDRRDWRIVQPNRRVEMQVFDKALLFELLDEG
ncbi:MAG: hypothetical protein RIC55_03915 [Pirellulaceae bacterium]